MGAASGVVEALAISPEARVVTMIVEVNEALAVIVDVGAPLHFTVNDWAPASTKVATKALEVEVGEVVPSPSRSEAIVAAVGAEEAPRVSVPPVTLTDLLEVSVGEFGPFAVGGPDGFEDGYDQVGSPRVRVTDGVKGQGTGSFGSSFLRVGGTASGPVVDRARAESIQEMVGTLREFFSRVSSNLLPSPPWLLFPSNTYLNFDFRAAFLAEWKAAGGLYYQWPRSLGG